VLATGDDVPDARSCEAIYRERRKVELMSVLSDFLVIHLAGGF
jgi:hypothetical protein